MPSATTKLNAGGLKLLLDATLIPVTTVTPSFNENAQAATDSTDFDATDQRVYRDQRPGVRESDVEVEFNFHTDVTQVSVLDKMASGATVALVLTTERTDPATALLAGNYMIGEAELEFNVAEDAVVAGSATLTNKGKFAKS